MLEQTDAVTNEVLEPIMFVLAYPTVWWNRTNFFILYDEYWWWGWETSFHWIWCTAWLDWHSTDSI